LDDWSESPELAGSVIMLDELHDSLIAEKPGLCECIDLEWSDLEMPTTETTQYLSSFVSAPDAGFAVKFYDLHRIDESSNLLFNALRMFHVER
jgi:hypothetical protein